MVVIVSVRSGDENRSVATCQLLSEEREVRVERARSCPNEQGRHGADDAVAVVGVHLLGPVLVPEPPSAPGAAVAQHGVFEVDHEHDAAALAIIRRRWRGSRRQDAPRGVAAGEDVLRESGSGGRLTLREVKGSRREAPRVAGSSVSPLDGRWWPEEPDAVHDPCVARLPVDAAAIVEEEDRRSHGRISGGGECSSCTVSMLVVA